MARTNDEWLERSNELARQAVTVFQPRTPITTKELFAGRWNELTEIADAVHQPGLHVVLYGERGVGKTSLANVVRPTVWVMDRDDPDDDEAASGSTNRLVVKVVANTKDTFSTIWERLFNEFVWPNSADPNQPNRTREIFNLPETLGVEDVRWVISHMTAGPVFIVDEFDQATHAASKDFTELIKTLSDLVIDCTIVLVGVSQTVGQLLQDHASVNRALAQIRLERMKPDELRQIVQTAEKALRIEFDQDARRLIVHVSQGLPHYTHLIGLHAVRAAAQRMSLDLVETEDVFEALKKAVKQAEQSVTEKHSLAVHSSQKNALYRQVLFACAVAATRSQDPLGFFIPSSVVEPLTTILGRSVSIATFTNHLGEFSDEKRGAVLERDGQPWGYRYRFRDPLLVPFVFMDAVDAGTTSGEALVQLLKQSNTDA